MSPQRSVRQSPRLSKDQWFSHFDAHALSGETMTSYCKRHGLNAKYFSGRRKQLGWKRSKPSDESNRSSNNGGFVAVHLDAQPSNIVATSSIDVTYQTLKLSLPADTSAQWLSTLLRGL